MRVLLSAFACAPGFGSEPNVGWEIVKQVAKQHQVWVLTYPANRPYIEKRLSKSDFSNVEFIYIDLTFPLEACAWKSGFHQIYYALWQLKALQVARDLHRKIRFEIAHHVTYVNSWIAPGIGGLGIPFIWNAGTKATTPWQFLRVMTWNEGMKELVRNLAIGISGWVSQKIVKKNVKHILTSSPAKDWDSSLPVVPFIIGGLSTTDLRTLRSIPLRTKNPLRIASIGYFRGLKGFSLGLKAFAQFLNSYPNTEYWLIGSGPEEVYLRSLAKEKQLEERVRFISFQTRKKLFQLLGEIDILLHPSLHDQFSYVILEAMAAGRPVICLDVGGPALLVEEDFGYKIAPTNPVKVVKDIANALEQLAFHPQKRLQMGENARRCAEEKWDWDLVGKRLLSFYN